MAASLAEEGTSREFPSLTRKRDIVLAFFNAISVVTGLAGALCALTFALAIVEGSDDALSNQQLSVSLAWQERLETVSMQFLRLTGFFCAIFIIAVRTLPAPVRPLGPTFTPCISTCSMQSVSPAPCLLFTRYMHSPRSIAPERSQRDPCVT